MTREKIILNDEKENIKKMFLNKQTVTITAKDIIEDAENLESDIKSLEGVESVFVSDRKCVCVYEQKYRPLDSVIQAIYRNGIEISDISTSGQNLETIFLALTGKELRE